MPMVGEGFKGIKLRGCCLMTEVEAIGKNGQAKRCWPLGIDHANDGIATPDGYQWADSISQWFAVEMYKGSGAMQIMSRSRLKKALEFVDRTFPAVRDGLGEDDIYSDGPLIPPIEEPYELTWKNKLAEYSECASFRDLPKMEHHIRLPEMITAHGEPYMPQDKYTRHRSGAQAPKTYWRVYPPPRRLFEHERLKANIHFSQNSREKVGSGHSSYVYRVRLEHPDYMHEVQVDNPSKDVEMLDATKGPELIKHDKVFYRALLNFYIHRFQTGEESSEFEFNADPVEDDEDYENALRRDDKLGVPWWAFQEKLDEMQKKKQVNGADSKMEIDEVEFETLNPCHVPLPADELKTEVFVQATGELFYTTSETVCQTLESPVQVRRRLAQDVLSSADYSAEFITTIEGMVTKPPSPPVSSSAKSWKKVQLSVTVIAKLPYDSFYAINFVENEGKTYGLFPHHLSETRKGFIQTKPIHQPQPCSAVVPKFYGMYVDKYRKPLLLLEECGDQILPGQLSGHDKTEIMSRILRLHRFGVIQNSMSARNIVVQPGPLSVPISSRTLKCPTFRIIDFGRGAYTPIHKQNDKYYKLAHEEEKQFAGEVNYGQWMPAGRIWHSED